MTEGIKKKKSFLAIASFVFAILSLIPLLGLLFCLPAMLTGLIAMVWISRKKETLNGRGLAIAAVLLSLLTLSGCLAFLKMTHGPSNAELLALFKDNREDFITLRSMFLEDSNVRTVEKENVYLFNSNMPGISVQRQARYDYLLDKLKFVAVWTWKSDEDNNKTAIAFFVHRGGWAVSGSATFFLWFDPSLTPSDAERMKGTQASSLTPIEGNWYLLRESN
ncbi:DUF4190 domain-containing protein [Omnitrophica bacterium]|nr:DUF4190 domain-containing protein [Candidatus Omnitrophota bacterium]